MNTGEAASNVPAEHNGAWMSRAGLEPVPHGDLLRAQALEVENARLKAEIDRLEQLVHLDPLTGLANRRRFEAALISETRRAIRTGDCLTLAMCDVDRFKRFNDGYGHACGDAVLVEVGRIMLKYCRRSGDMAARFGGEEFALILPRVEPLNSLTIAESLRRSVRAHRMEASTVPGITISIGVTTFRGTLPCTPAALIETADKALYEAKRAGRDRTCYRAVSHAR